MQTAVWIHLDLHQHGRAADGPAVGKFAERLAAFEAAKAARATA
jgi:hypothetical protein